MELTLETPRLRVRPFGEKMRRRWRRSWEIRR